VRELTEQLRFRCAAFKELNTIETSNLVEKINWDAFCDFFLGLDSENRRIMDHLVSGESNAE
jgi:hypothetical protein